VSTIDDLSARALRNAAEARKRAAEIAAREWRPKSPEVGQRRDLPKPPKQDPYASRPEGDWWNR
jgi:hypothetical protein